MRRGRPPRLGIVVSLAALLAAAAPGHAAYRIDECELNAGGHPSGGLMLQSPGLRMTVDAVSGGTMAPALRSAGFAMDAGFARSYPPPFEVRGLVAMQDKATFAWQPDPSVGGYVVYRGDVGQLAAGYGACRMAGLPLQSAVLDEVPDSGHAYFYLVTAMSRLDEEGSAGSDSGGTPRSMPPPCP